MLLENSRSSSSSSISRICSNVIGSKLSPQSGSPIEPFSDYHHAHLVSGKGFCSKFNARRTEACCKGAKRGVRSGGGRGVVCGGYEVLRMEGEHIRLWGCTYPIFHRRRWINVSRGHTLCFRAGAVGSLRTKVPEPLTSPHAPKLKKNFPVR